MGWLFNRNKKLIDEDIGQTEEALREISAKNMALEIVVSFVANAFSKTTFKFKGENAQDRLYFLNNSPNINQSGQSFLQEFAETLIHNGEAVIFEKDDQFFVADSFYREENITGDIFKGITKGDWSSPTDLRRDEVLYFKYKNKRLESFVHNLWSEYGSILSRLLANQKTANQIRATFELNTKKNAIEDKETRIAIKKFVSSIASKIRKDDVVVIPTSPDNKYSEVSSSGSGSSKKGISYLDQVDSLKKMYVDDVSSILNIPRGLILGDKADNDKNYNLFIETVVEYFQNLFVSELNKTLTPEEYQKGMKYSANSVRYRDIFELATNFDKLISSGAFNRNELREESGYDPIEGGDQFLITKNYMTFTERNEEGNVGT